ncbi:hypothetical protein BY458DRAFT_521117 [Sporodiniella umbellata]|nr:hypothetical protein BY458DRAFT_521117 [Sporodiniella umbellata]
MTTLENKAVDLRTSETKVSLTREDILLLAQNEYARQLRKYTEAQLEKTKPKDSLSP